MVNLHTCNPRYHHNKQAKHDYPRHTNLEDSDLYVDRGYAALNPSQLGEFVLYVLRDEVQSTRNTDAHSATKRPSISTQMMVISEHSLTPGPETSHGDKI